VSWREEATPFERKVYEAVLKIPKGQTRTYAQIARAIGRPKAARAVGQALKRNRWPEGHGAASASRSHRAPRIPCHRVVSSDGSLGGPASGGTTPGRAAWRLPEKLLGGYSAAGGPRRKRQLLRLEGVKLK
jgi:O6-methylguanine-DNA--protein-cysteine methyltransferase